MSVKHIKSALILSALLLFSQQVRAQLGNDPFLQKSSFVAGVSYSRILGSKVFDQDLDKFTFGYLYEAPFQKNVNFDIGSVFMVKGGRSRYENISQTFGYLDFPLIANYVFNPSFKLGGGLMPSVYLYNTLRHRGTHSVISPNSYDYSPFNYDVSLAAKLDLRLTPNASLVVMGSYSMRSNAPGSNALHFANGSVMLKVGLGSSINKVQSVIQKGRVDEIEFVKLASGCLLVVLNDRERFADYYRQKGDTAKANLVLKDARIKNEALKRAFTEYFTFCQVYFVESNEVGKACDKDSSCPILSTNGTHTTLGKLVEKPYVFFKPGDIYFSEGNPIKQGYYFMDIDCEILYDPYPTKSFAAITKLTDIDRLVKELNRRMQEREAQIKERRYFTEDLLSR
ncbi:hypothetical protein GC194_09855 [bacterium]|nr:hypothetical protein [bacterium]